MKEYTERLEKIEAALKSWLPDNVDSEWAEKVFPVKSRPNTARAVRALREQIIPRWTQWNKYGFRNRNCSNL